MLAIVGSRQSCLTFGRALEMDGDQMGGGEVGMARLRKLRIFSCQRKRGRV